MTTQVGIYIDLTVNGLITSPTIPLSREVKTLLIKVKEQ